ncbi:uncharacterized protein LOC118404996 [Branchiostoma floridae]|uniref:Uncharacterized protein LOC118404996 n=1 Tax=Branchiostoma floridae TaxID=7739 RepID=A0A9J7KFE0_BRAFL|nr:uncharacterized protein LOC118404996 [Branchiostoma floridae]
MAETLRTLVNGAECEVQDSLLKDGNEVKLTHVEDVPVSAEVYWSAFRDFIELQLNWKRHENLKVLKGNGGIGTEISFYYNLLDIKDGQRTQKLREKNDSTKTWSVEEVGPNNFYTSYLMTIKAEGEAAQAKVTISVCMVYAMKNVEERRQDIVYHKVYLLGARIRDILNFVVRENLDGNHRFEMEVACSRRKLWGVVGNFHNVSWVMDTTNADVTGLRRLMCFNNDRTLEVRLAWVDDDDYLFVYEGDVHCKYYRGRLQLFAVNPHKVKVVYDCTFLPVNDEPMEEFKKWFIPAIKTRFEWIQVWHVDIKPVFVILLLFDIQYTSYPIANPNATPTITTKMQNQIMQETTSAKRVEVTSGYPEGYLRTRRRVHPRKKRPNRGLQSSEPTAPKAKKGKHANFRGYKRGYGAMAQLEKFGESRLKLAAEGTAAEPDEPATLETTSDDLSDEYDGPSVESVVGEGSAQVTQQRSLGFRSGLRAMAKGAMARVWPLPSLGAAPTGPPKFTKGEHTTTASGNVMGPVEEVWGVFRPFGQDCMEYWKIYDSMEIEEPGNDVQGCIRAFVTSKTKSKIREKLEWRDDENHVEIYSLLSMDPAPPVEMTNVYTTVTMTSVGEKETEVKFECTFDASLPMAVPGIQDNQKGAYMACINGLQQLFHSEVGTLEVVVKSAKDLAVSGDSYKVDPYVMLVANDGKPVNTKVCRGTQNPIWDEKFPLSLTSRTRNVVFTVMDYSKSKDIGKSVVNIEELASGKEKNMSLKLQGGGTLTVRLYLKMHQKPQQLEEGEKVIPGIMLPFIAPVFQSELDTIRNEFTHLIMSFLGPGQKYGLIRTTRLRTHPEVPLEEMPAACLPLPTEEWFSAKKHGRLMERLAEFIGSQAKFMMRFAEAKKKGMWDPWKANFSGYLPANERLIELWQNDEEFCRQFIQGINPMMLKVCKEQSQIPASMLGLKVQGKTTLQLMAENRLFIVDYAPMLGAPATPGKFFYAPIVLMYKEELGDGKSRLNMLGIQLTRKSGKNKVYSPETAKTHPNKYMFAKMHVMSADNNVHQFLYHLGYTHLGMEPIAVSLHTHLPPDHPIHRLLLPHFKDTIGINYLARHSLVSRIFPITDPMFATSTVGGLHMFIKEWRKYNFMDMAFPEELKRRGFDEAKSDGLEDYFFRDDGFKLWHIYKDYVTGVVEEAYPADQKVTDDKALQDFCQMIEGEGQLRGFPREISTKKLLVDCLTNIMFNVSAQHSAVNFPQYDYYSFIPNRPAQLNMEMPHGPNDMLESAILDALPDAKYTSLQVLLSYMLSMPSQTAITGVEAMKEVYPEVHEKFQEQLQDLSNEIKGRNEGLKAEGKVAYTYLDPENVAMSIDI